MAEAGTHLNPVVPDVGAPGSHQVHIDTAALEAAAAEKAGTKETAQSLDVTPAQFEKFWDDENATYHWENHSKEMKWVMENGGATPPAEPAVVPAVAGDGDGVEGVPDPDDQVGAAFSLAGLDIDAVNLEIATSGTIPQAAVDALLKVGFDEDSVRDYVTHTGDTVKAHTAVLEAHFGGPEGMAKLRVWSKANLSQEEINQYQSLLSKRDSWRPTADALLARAGQPAGEVKDPIVPSNLPKTPETAATAAIPYANQAAMMADMRKPEYRKDPVFHAGVVAKARASSWDSNPRLHSL